MTTSKVIAELVQTCINNLYLRGRLLKKLEYIPKSPKFSKVPSIMTEVVDEDKGSNRTLIRGYCET